MKLKAASWENRILSHLCSGLWPKNKCIIHPITLYITCAYKALRAEKVRQLFHIIKWFNCKVEIAWCILTIAFLINIGSICHSNHLTTVLNIIQWTWQKGENWIKIVFYAEWIVINQQIGDKILHSFPFQYRALV